MLACRIHSDISSVEKGVRGFVRMLEGLKMHMEEFQQRITDLGPVMVPMFSQAAAPAPVQQWSLQLRAFLCLTVTDASPTAMQWLLRVWWW